MFREHNRHPLPAAIWDRSWKGAFRRRFMRPIGKPKAGTVPKVPWERLLRHRRRSTLALTVATVAAILLLVDNILRDQALAPVWQMAYLSLYGVMSFFMIQSFYKILIGTWHVSRGIAGNPYHPLRERRDPPGGETMALLFPVYQEDVARVLAGLVATWDAIRAYRPDLAPRAHTFLLSDSRRPAMVAHEAMAVQRLKRERPDLPLFYRHRSINANQKMGNLSDFFRRYGRHYAYTLVMDADSIMDGEACIEMWRAMAAHHRIGILQTNPRPVFRESFFGRMLQFAAHLYGSVFSYSLMVMQMGHAGYIGHNALIRTQAFMDHCILPKLPGPKPWGGKPLSHDFVEAAMMCRAGYEVWFVPELTGSYEEVPANIIAFLVRERRWMQGNLQHLRLLFLNGIRGMHREIFINGAMGYVTAPIWFVFLLVSAYTMVHFLSAANLSVGSVQMLMVPMGLLLAASMVFLFLPRILAILTHMRSHKAPMYGGRIKLIWSVLADTVLSFFYAPLMMIMVSYFLWAWVKRRTVSWGQQQRDDRAVAWKDAWKSFRGVMVLGIAGWAALLALVHGAIQSLHAMLLESITYGWIQPGSMLMWYAPILAGWALSVFLVQWTSRTFPTINRIRWFAIPEELNPPKVLQEVRTLEQQFRSWWEIPDTDDPKEYLPVFVRICKAQQADLVELPHRHTKTELYRRLHDKAMAQGGLSQREWILLLGSQQFRHYLCSDAGSEFLAALH